MAELEAETGRKMIDFMCSGQDKKDVRRKYDDDDGGDRAGAMSDHSNNRLAQEIRKDIAYPKQYESTNFMRRTQISGSGAKNPRNENRIPSHRATTKKTTHTQAHILEIVGGRGAYEKICVFAIK